MCFLFNILFFVSFPFLFSIAFELGVRGEVVRVWERGGVPGEMGHAVTAVHTGLNRKEQFFFLHVMLVEGYSLSACWLLDLQMY